MQEREFLELLDRAMRTIEQEDGIEFPDDFMVVNLGELLEVGPPPEFIRDLLPEPNCNDPSCASCMMLRRLRGESLEPIPVRPTDGPPIII